MMYFEVTERSRVVQSTENRFTEQRPSLCSPHIQDEISETGQI